MSSENLYRPPREGSQAERSPFDIPDELMGKMSTALSIYFADFPVLAAIVLTIWLPVDVATNLLSLSSVTFNIGGIFQALAAPLAIASVIHAVDASRKGLRPGYSASIRSGLGDWGSLFAVTIVSGLLIVIGLVLLVVPGVYLAARFALVSPLVVLEGTGVADSLERSGNLTEGRRLQILVGGGLFFLAAVAVMPGYFLVGYLEESSLISLPLGAVLTTGVDIFGNLVGVPVTILMLLFYWEAIGKSSEDGPLGTGVENTGYAGPSFGA